MFNSVQRKNSRRETTKGRKTIVAIVIFAVISAMGWPSVSTAGPGFAGIPEVLKLLDHLIKQVDGLELACSTPDLVPLPDPNQFVGFCRFDDQGRLLLRVQNQGGGAAGPSQTLVVFRTASGEQDLFVDTPQLAGFTGTDLVMAIPGTCFGNFFGTDDNNVCKFQILVDAKIGSQFGAVAESNELNNGAFGACQGLL